MIAKLLKSFGPSEQFLMNSELKRRLGEVADDQLRETLESEWAKVDLKFLRDLTGIAGVATRFVLALKPSQRRLAINILSVIVKSMTGLPLWLRWGGNVLLSAAPGAIDRALELERRGEKASYTHEGQKVEYDAINLLDPRLSFAKLQNFLTHLFRTDEVQSEVAHLYAEDTCCTGPEEFSLLHRIGGCGGADVQNKFTGSIYELEHRFVRQSCDRCFPHHQVKSTGAQPGNNRPADEETPLHRMEHWQAESLALLHAILELRRLEMIHQPTSFNTLMALIVHSLAIHPGVLRFLPRFTPEQIRAIYREIERLRSWYMLGGEDELADGGVPIMERFRQAGHQLWHPHPQPGGPGPDTNAREPNFFRRVNRAWGALWQDDNPDANRPEQQTLHAQVTRAEAEQARQRILEVLNEFRPYLDGVCRNVGRERLGRIERHWLGTLDWFDDRFTDVERARLRAFRRSIITRHWRWMVPSAVLAITAVVGVALTGGGSLAAVIGTAVIGTLLISAVACLVLLLGTGTWFVGGICLNVPMLIVFNYVWWLTDIDLPRIVYQSVALFIALEWFFGIIMAGTAVFLPRVLIPMVCDLADAAWWLLPSAPGRGFWGFTSDVIKLGWWAWDGAKGASPFDARRRKTYRPSLAEKALGPLTTITIVAMASVVLVTLMNVAMFTLPGAIAFVFMGAAMVALYVEYLRKGRWRLNLVELKEKFLIGDKILAYIAMGTMGIGFLVCMIQTALFPFIFAWTN